MRLFSSRERCSHHMRLGTCMWARCSSLFYFIVVGERNSQQPVAACRTSSSADLFPSPRLLHPQTCFPVLVFFIFKSCFCTLQQKSDRSMIASFKMLRNRHSLLRSQLTSSQSSTSPPSYITVKSPLSPPPTTLHKSYSPEELMT